jgi:hypothetical protein
MSSLHSSPAPEPPPRTPSVVPEQTIITEEGSVGASVGGSPFGNGQGHLAVKLGRRPRVANDASRTAANANHRRHVPTLSCESDAREWMRFTDQSGDCLRYFADPSTRVSASHRGSAVARERLSDRKTGMAFDRGDGRVAQDVR